MISEQFPGSGPDRTNIGAHSPQIIPNRPNTHSATVFPTIFFGPANFVESMQNRLQSGAAAAAAGPETLCAKVQIMGRGGNANIHSLQHEI